MTNSIYLYIILLVARGSSLTEAFVSKPEALRENPNSHVVPEWRETGLHSNRQQQQPLLHIPVHYSHHHNSRLIFCESISKAKNFLNDVDITLY